MGMLIEGQLTKDGLGEEPGNGDFKRVESTFRNWITPDGSAGPTGDSGFAAEADRYHLYVSMACPWAHRTVIFRKLKQLENIIGLSVVEPDMLGDGWSFSSGTDANKQYIDHLYAYKYMHELYTRADKNVTGRITVPVLWDKKLNTIVNNESSEIIRMLNSAFNALVENKKDYYPESLRNRIDTINQPIYENINNGVYRCGFATTQDNYEEAFNRLFNELDNVEHILSANRYLLGKQLTEADWRLFTTLIRFDSVYVGHFKCNLKRIADYPNLFHYLKELYQLPGIAETVDMNYIKRHYYYSHTSVNPTQIIAKGPAIDFYEPHNRSDNFRE